MKKLLIILFVIISTPSMAAYTNDIVGGCAAGTPAFRPVFQPNEYTCNAGYFLPADTLGCEPCPTGHTCNGGTFTYSETKAQGINFTRPTTQDVVKSCSVNFGTVLSPIFQKNQVNLNFDDGNGNITQTTCDYGDTITIPETIPTRPGYNFTGWKVRENNN